MQASDAAAWEEIACVNIAKAAAVARCLAKVREIALGKRTDSAELRALSSKAMTAVKIHDWLELAMAWKNAGNDPQLLNGTVREISQAAAKAAFQDPIMGQYVSDNVKDISQINESVQSLFDRSYHSLLEEFPDAPAPSLRAFAAPSTPLPLPMEPPTTKSIAVDRDACLKAVNVKIAACMNDAFSLSTRNQADFSYIAKCKNKFSSETAACFP